MKAVSERYLAAVNLSHDTVTQVTCTPPGGDPVELAVTSCVVSMSTGTGRRRTATVTATPRAGVDLFAITSTPGAIFQIEHGVRHGPRDVEMVPVFYGEAASGGVAVGHGDIRLSLTDMWSRIERCRLISPYSPSSGATRARRITDLITAAIPGAAFKQSADGGTLTGKMGTWDRDRTQAIKDLAADGGIEVWPDADGTWVIRNAPQINPKASVFTYKTGDPDGNILSAERERPLDRLYNTVVVLPGEKQSWKRQTVTVPLSSPRHPSKVGVVPYFYASPTLKNANSALNAANTILARVVGTAERLAITGLANAALEPGDTITALHVASAADPGFQVAHLIDSARLDCLANDMTIDTMAIAELEEETG